MQCDSRLREQRARRQAGGRGRNPAIKSKAIKIINITALQPGFARVTGRREFPTTRYANLHHCRPRVYTCIRVYTCTCSDWERHSRSSYKSIRQIAARARRFYRVTTGTITRIRAESNSTPLCFFSLSLFFLFLFSFLTPKGAHSRARRDYRLTPKRISVNAGSGEGKGVAAARFDFLRARTYAVRASALLSIPIFIPPPNIFDSHHSRRL